MEQVFLLHVKAHSELSLFEETFATRKEHISEMKPFSDREIFHFLHERKILQGKQNFRYFAKILSQVYRLS